MFHLLFFHYQISNALHRHIHALCIKICVCGQCIVCPPQTEFLDSEMQSVSLHVLHLPSQRQKIRRLQKYQISKFSEFCYAFAQGKTYFSAAQTLLEQLELMVFGVSFFSESLRFLVFFQDFSYYILSFCICEMKIIFRMLSAKSKRRHG